MTTARALAMKGYSVALFDSGKLAQEASRAAGGILSSMRPWSENPISAKLSSSGKACYEDFVFELKQETNIDAEYYRSGLLMINESDVTQSRVWANENQVVYTNTYDDYPIGMSIPDDVFFMPHIAQVRVPFLLRALQASLVKYNVDIYENSAVERFNMKAGRCESIQIGQKNYTAESFIITAGAWTQELLGINAGDININPVLGQMLCVKFSEQPLRTMILDGAHYLIPRLDGHVLIGSTMEYVGYDKRTTLAAREELMAWASKLWPEIEKAAFVTHWSGLRPATENSKPYIGAVQGLDNVYVNAGHFRKGILQSPVCAKKIADMITLA